MDCPNRIVVMTSNHPDKLDPALIRPGRVNLKLLLDYIELPEVKLMVDHYFGGYRGETLSSAQLCGGASVGLARHDTLATSQCAPSMIRPTSLRVADAWAREWGVPCEMHG